MSSSAFRRKNLLLLVTSGAALLAAGLWARVPVWIQYQRSQAESALRRDEPETALARLKSAERTAPDDPETQFWLARVYRRLDRFDKMNEHLERCERLGVLSERLRRERLLAQAQSGRLDAAQSHLPRLLQDAGDDGPEICRAFINGYCLQLEFQAALPLLEAWQKDYPEDAEPRFLRGWVWYSQRQWVPAAEAYREGLEFAPERFEPRLRLAECLLKIKQPAQAEPHFRRCLQAQPDHLDSLVGLAQCRLGTSQLDEARRLLRKALEGDSHHASARLLLGQLELTAGRPRHAIRCVQPLIESWPDDVTACYVMAQAHQALGDRAAANPYFNKVQEGERELGRMGKLTEEIRRRPHEVRLRHELGELLMRYRSREEGVSWLRSVLLLDPDHRPSHAILAHYHARRGEHQLAQHHRQESDGIEAND